MNRELTSPEHERRTKRNTNKEFTYNLFGRGAAPHPTLQFALGVLDGVLRGVCCDDRGAWCE